jgi:thymidine phosphorylase
MEDFLRRTLMSAGRVEEAEAEWAASVLATLVVGNFAVAKMTAAEVASELVPGAAADAEDDFLRAEASNAWLRLAEIGSREDREAAINNAVDAYHGSLVLAADMLRISRDFDQAERRYEQAVESGLPGAIRGLAALHDDQGQLQTWARSVAPQVFADPSEVVRAEAVEVLAAYLDELTLEQAERVAGGLSDPGLRARSLISLLSHLPPHRARVVAAEARAAAESVLTRDERVDLIAALLAAQPGPEPGRSEPPGMIRSPSTPALLAELIRRKRDGGELSADEIEEVVAGITDGTVTDAQVGALAMAIVLRGLTMEEGVALTSSMARSGDVLTWEDLRMGRPVLDKHSTGGVGDNVSLLLAPIVAACGGAVPMIAGRGLGHAGGTLDKLESIPGYDVAPSVERLRAAVERVGCAIVGQTAALAPADRRLYAIRDATGTVESIPLIVASLLSKKLAAGLDALVVDVKVGSGAMLPDLDRARELAREIVQMAVGSGLPTRALLTDMNQVLGRTAGNAVEVREAIDHLTGAARDPRLREVTLALSAELIALGGVAADVKSARAACERALDSGAAAERFGAMVVELGGPVQLVDDPGRFLPAAPVVQAVEAVQPGVVGLVDVRAVGIAVVTLGGGRVRETDAIDHSVGLTEVAGIGERVGPGERPLAIVHARQRDDAERAVEAVRAAYVVGEGEAKVLAPVMEILRNE